MNNIFKDKFSLFTILFLVVIIGTSIYYYSSQFGGELSENKNDWGLFGDYFGGLVGSLIALLALL